MAKQYAKLDEEEKSGISKILGESDACIVVAGRHGEDDQVGVSLSFKGGPTELTILMVDLLNDQSIQPVIVDAVGIWAQNRGFIFSDEVDPSGAVAQEVGDPTNIIKVDFTKN